MHWMRVASLVMVILEHWNVCVCVFVCLFARVNCCWFWTTIATNWCVPSRFCIDAFHCQPLLQERELKYTNAKTIIPLEAEAIPLWWQRVLYCEYWQTDHLIVHLICLPPECCFDKSCYKLVHRVLWLQHNSLKSNLKFIPITVINFFHRQRVPN